MISIETWRPSIGRHNNVKLKSLNKARKLPDSANAACLSLSTLLFTVFCAVVIGTLLRIRCVETILGPTQNHEGK